MRPGAETDDLSLISDDPSMELAANRTSLGFERTMMGADRTLMAIVRTALSLIGFGFTIHTVFQKLSEGSVLPLNEDSPRNFGLALILIGVVMLIMGIWSHLRFQRNFKVRQARLVHLKLLRYSIAYPAAPTFAVAAALLFVGIAAFAVIVFNALD